MMPEWPEVIFCGLRLKKLKWFALEWGVEAFESAPVAMPPSAKTKLVRLMHCC